MIESLKAPIHNAAPAALPENHITLIGYQNIAPNGDLIYWVMM